jgi:RNA polymerase sigma-70 factor, ECF subfamily
MNDSSDQNLWYVQQLIGWQPRLYAFILALTGNPNEADDVLQNVNLVLLKKQDAFRADADFGAWAMQIAHLEVQHHRDRSALARRRFDDALIGQLAAKVRKSNDEPGLELRALRDCMARLSTSEREMLVLRYSDNSVGAIAEKWGRTVASVSQTLYRIRGKLAECIKRSLEAERRDES